MVILTARTNNESFDAYASRLYRNAKEYGINCEDIAKLLNKESGEPAKGESAFRKYYTAFNRGRDYERSQMEGEIDDELVVSLRSERESLQKERVKLRDQRREYNRALAEDARNDFLYDELVEAARKMPPFSICAAPTMVSDYEAVVVLNDLHYGMRTDNMFNRYDPDICIGRLAEYAGKIREYFKMYHPKKCHLVILGDLWHGHIHTSLRVGATETTVEQVMRSCELVAQFINEIMDCVPSIDVYTTYGNHSRVIANKKDSVHHDNLELLVPFWLKERFRLHDNIQFFDGVTKGILYFEVKGYGFIATHGDLEDFAKYGTTMQAVFSKMYGYNVDYAIMGDKHHLEVKDSCGVESIICPALCGVDDYANEKRLYSKPGQLMMMVNHNGAECRIPVMF